MGKVFRAIDKINIWVGRISCVLLISIMIACVIEVIARYAFNRPTVWAFEFEQLTCAVMFVILGGFVQFLKAHISIEVVYERLSPSLKFFLRSFFYLVFLFATAAVIYAGSGYAITSIKIWEKSYTSWAPPIWPVKLMIPVGGFLLFIQLVADFVRELKEAKR